MSHRVITYVQAADRICGGNINTFYGLVKRGVLSGAIVRIPGCRPGVREDLLDQIIKSHTNQEL
ncbi:MAG: hypothetical protein HOC20_13935 [Chloroflexi bacterium]|nr:hypothetical protein [Chloroflexota bacterium]